LGGSGGSRVIIVVDVHGFGGKSGIKISGVIFSLEELAGGRRGGDESGEIGATYSKMLKLRFRRGHPDRREEERERAGVGVVG
jgi:hypothetical protein